MQHRFSLLCGERIMQSVCEFRPYIFSDEELHRLVVVADSLSPSYRTKSHQQIYPVLVRMLIGTGMRIGERSKGNMVSVCA